MRRDTATEGNPHARPRFYYSRAVHVGFVANSETEVNAFYEAAIGAGATDNGKPGARLYYDPRYYAANIFDPDGYSIEVVFKSWQHPQS